MNLILVVADEVNEGVVQLSDYRAEHIVKVLRGEAGDFIRIGLVNGKLGRGRIIEINKKYPFTVVIDCVFDEMPPDKASVDLLLALPRPIMLKRIFSQATSLGVETIHILNSKRVEKSFWESGLTEQLEYRPHLLHGLEQAVDTVLPSIYFHRSFKKFSDEYFPTLATKYSHHVFAHPDSNDVLSNVLPGPIGNVLLAIGPEGGWIDYEVKKFLALGFSGFSIGERILKVDTAVINIHGRIVAERERVNNS